MGIVWKKQNVRNGCVPACFSMLFTEYGIKVSDVKFIELSLMPYLIRYDYDRYICGTKVQNTEVLSIVPNSLGFKFNDLSFSNWKEYINYATKINKPFITTGSIKFLNSPDYSEYKNSDIRSGHAIIVEKVDKEYFYILDPAAGLKREKNYTFDEVKARVYYKMSYEEMKNNIEFRSKFLIGYLEKISFTQSKKSELIEASIDVISELHSVVDQKINTLGSSPSYDKFYSLLTECVFPISIDLKDALMSIEKPSLEIIRSIEILQEILDSTLKIQNRYKSNLDLDLKSYFDMLEVNFRNFEKLYLTILHKVK